MALRKEQQGLTLRLGDAVVVAQTIERKRKELNREFKASPLKGTRRQTTVIKRQQHRAAQEEKRRQQAINPMVKGLAGVTGVTVNEDGLIGLADLREQRPDIFKLKPIPVEGAPPTFKDAITRLRKAEGRKDKYGDE